MARTGQQQAQSADTTNTADQQTAFNAEQSDVNQYNQNLGTLSRGGSVAANPWMSPTYLASQNRQTADSLNSATNAGTAATTALNRRTGGTNTAATIAANSGLALQKARLSDQLTAQRTAQDYNKNVQYQQQMAAAPLAGAGVEQGAYGTATGAQSSDIGDLTQFGLASYGPYNSLITGLTGAAGAVGGGFAQKCYIAALVFNEDFHTGPRVNLVRNWLYNEFAPSSKIATWLVGLYTKYGERIARGKNPLVRAFFTPLFHLALRRARKGAK